MEKNKFTLFTNHDILKLIGPLVLEQTLFMAVGLSDTVMVASLGENSVSAVSLSDMFTVFIGNVFFALSTGGAVIVSQFIGAKNFIRANESAKQLTVMVGVIGLAVALLCEFFSIHIIRILFGELEPDLMRQTVQYFKITALSMPFIAVYGGCAALFRSMNKTKTTMYISLFSNIINIVGNAVFIFVFHWGVAGAAYATVISRVFSCITIFCMASNTSNMVHIRFRNGFRFSWDLMKRILSIGIPGGIENGTFQLGRLLVLGLIAAYGTTEIAANAVANTLDAAGCILGSSFCLAIVTVIGQSVGCRREDQIRYYVRKMMTWAYTAHVGWNLILLALTPLLLKCFSNLSPEVHRLSLILILIHNGLGMIFWPMSFVFPNVLRSMNDVKWPMMISISSMLLIRLLGSYILAGIIHSGIIAVWIMMVFDWIVRITGFYLRYRSNAWLKLSGCR